MIEKEENAVRIVTGPSGYILNLFLVLCVSRSGPAILIDEYWVVVISRYNL